MCHLCQIITILPLCLFHMSLIILETDVIDNAVVFICIEKVYLLSYINYFIIIMHISDKNMNNS